MKPQEANKIIAEYMGNRSKEETVIEYEPLIVEYVGVNYSESLDALVPVWGKMAKNKFKVEIGKNWNDGESWLCLVTDDGIHEGSPCYKPIQEAAAVATAKAILKITEQKERE